MAAAPAPAAAPPEAVCIICLDRGDEPLLRDCGCRGPTAGFAHMPCLVRHVANAAGSDGLWSNCTVCEEPFSGAVRMALARARWMRALGREEDDWERRAAMRLLASALAQSGDCAAALPLAEKSLVADRRIHGNLHRETLVSLHFLAHLRVRLYKPTAALPLAEECLLTSRQTLGDEDEQTLRAMSLLSEVYYDLADFEKALPLARQVLDVRRRTLTDYHPKTKNAFEHVSEMLMEMNEDEAAEQLCADFEDEDEDDDFDEGLLDDDGEEEQQEQQDQQSQAGDQQPEQQQEEQPEPQSEQPPLAEGWTAVPHGDRVYYWHAETAESTWDRPQAPPADDTEQHEETEVHESNVQK